jgi:hypothetical protein
MSIGQAQADESFGAPKDVVMFIVLIVETVAAHERTMTSRCPLRSRGTARLASLMLVSLASLAVVSPAFADWTLGVFVGVAHTRPTSLTLIQPTEGTDVTVSPVRYRSESLTPPIYYGYRAAFFPRSSWLGVEGEFVHLKVVADTARDVEISGALRGSPVGGSAPLSSIVDAFSITHGVNLLLVNAVARRRVGVDPAGHARWTFTARLGAGASIPHAESTIGGRRSEGYEWGAPSLQAAAGVEVRVTRVLSLIGEYKLTHSVQDVTVANGSARTPLTTHHLVVGTAVRLGVPRRVP